MMAELKIADSFWIDEPDKTDELPPVKPIAAHPGQNGSANPVAEAHESMLTAADIEPAPDYEPHPSEPMANATGAYEIGVEEIEIKIADVYECEASIEVVRGTDGKWRASYSCESPRSSYMSCVSVDSEQFESRRDAVLTMGAEIILKLKIERNKGLTEIVRAAVAEAADKPEPVIVDAPTDAEAIAAVENKDSKADELLPTLAEAIEKMDGAVESNPLPTLNEVVDAMRSADLNVIKQAVAEEYPYSSPAAIAAYATALEEAESTLCACVLALQDIAAAHKEAKSEAKAAGETLAKITRCGPERDLEEQPKIRQPAKPDFSCQGDAVATVAVVDADSDPNSPPPLADPIPVGAKPLSDTWKKVDIEVLALGGGLTNKLRESDINTIGQIEDLRAKGSQPGVGLYSIKGIGQKKVDKIEESVLDWLSRNRDKEVMAEAAAKGGA
jgi:hypothetical protein